MASPIGHCTHILPFHHIWETTSMVCHPILFSRDLSKPPVQYGTQGVMGRKIQQKRTLYFCLTRQAKTSICR